MVIFETGPTRCANVFLCHLFESVFDNSKSLKIPLDFKNENHINEFIKENQISDKKYLLGLNHMHRMLEARLAYKYNIFLIFVFRNPLDSILSSIRLQTSRGIVENKRQRFKQVIFNIISYNSIYFTLILFKLFNKDHLAITFQQLVKYPKDVSLDISSALNLPSSFDENIVQEYLQSSKQKRATERKTKYSGLMWNEKLIIYLFCFPFYKSLGPLFKLPT